MDNWRFVPIKLVLLEKVTHLHFNEFQHLWVVNEVNFVHENDQGRYTYLASEQDVLTGLWHRAVSCSNHNDCTVHLGSTRYHVLHIVSVAWAVNMCVVTLDGLILNVCGVDGDTTLFFFRSGVNRIVIFLLSKTHIR